MTFVLEIKEEATAKIVEAYLYYKAKQEGVGEAF